MFTYRYILMHMPAAVFRSVSFVSSSIYHLFGLLAAFASDFKNRSARRGKQGHEQMQTNHQSEILKNSKKYNVVEINFFEY